MQKPNTAHLRVLFFLRTPNCKHLCTVRLSVHLSCLACFRQNGASSLLVDARVSARRHRRHFRPSSGHRRSVHFLLGPHAANSTLSILLRFGGGASHWPGSLRNQCDCAGGHSHEETVRVHSSVPVPITAEHHQLENSRLPPSRESVLRILRRPRP